MKKIFAAFTILVMIFTAAAAFAQEADVPTFTYGVQFHMDIDQVMKLVPMTQYEIESEETQGGVMFRNIEYEKETDISGLIAQIKYLFVRNSLVAIRLDIEDDTGYESIRAILTETYGTAVPFDAAQIGNGRYALDDNGDLRDCREMIVSGGLTIVLEQDGDGDVDVTFLDTTAAYINS